MYHFHRKAKILLKPVIWKLFFYDIMQRKTRCNFSTRKNFCGQNTCNSSIFMSQSQMYASKIAKVSYFTVLYNLKKNMSLYQFKKMFDLMILILNDRLTLLFSGDML